MLKSLVADAVYSFLQGFEEVSDTLEDYVEAIEVSRVSPLQIQVKIWPIKRAPRYFIVQVKETL